MPKRKLSKTDNHKAAKRRRLPAPEQTSKDEVESEDIRNNFVYEPLDHGTDSIRVFELYPGPKDSIIRCTMRNAKISDEAHICLSYTWQPSNPQHTIEVNGRSHSVGENLCQFLRAYRTYMTRKNAADRGSPLWVDALCINQPDIEERNHQVQQMSDIYRNAAKVLVWLGVLDDQVRTFLRRICPDAEKTQYNDADASQKLRFQRHARALSTAEYWTRIWVAQELLLPGNGNVFLFEGWASYELGELYAPLTAIRVQDSEKPIMLCQEYISRRQFGILLHDFHFQSMMCSDFSRLLFHFGYCGCQDSRDRVFALVPLSTVQGHFNIDYSKNRYALFRHVLEQAMEGACIDGLLILGAQLIEALELREPTTE
ncbi:heterokaryon incompatibility protein-domain-containing protein, partial [Paraphoma chrysanthemicola]